MFFLVKGSGETAKTSGAGGAGPLGPAEFLRDDRPEVRKFHARLGTAAGFHQFVTVAMVRDLRIERADDGGVVHPLGELGQ